ncbi:MAG: hypothetical protein KAJ07_02245 [Planctomycetes bacterium]|nr:hypothetical protein [Planctomycetota bacterium]
MRNVLLALIAIVLLAGGPLMATECGGYIDGLVSLWNLDEGAGTTAYDSGGDNDGTLFGDPLWDTNGGQIGGALEFDGNGDYIRTTYEGGPSEYTIALWYNLNEDIEINTSNTASMKVLLSKTGDEAYRVDSWHLKFYLHGLTLWNETSAGNYSWVGYNPGMFYKDQWHYVVATGTSTEGRVYFDGELKNTTYDNFVVGVWDDSVPLDIARPYNGTPADRFFNGKIDEVAVFDRVLSPEEIWQSYVDGLEGQGYPYDHKAVAVSKIDNAIAQKENLIITIETTIAEEESAITELDALVECGDNIDLKPKAIHQAKQEIRQAIHRQEKLKKELLKSIDDLNKALNRLGYDPVSASE